MQKHLKIGTPPWLEAVFASPPTRDVRGRSRPTQRHAVIEDEKKIYAEGGNTATSRSLLSTMVKAGVVKRYKLEPFELSIAEHGVKAIPDVLFEHADGSLYVVENKSARYLTSERVEKCKAVQAVVNGAGMKYLLWTDRWPLTPNCQRLLRHARRHATSAVAKDSVEKAIQTVSNCRMTFGELRTRGVYRPEIMTAIWEGGLHTDLLTELSDDTVVDTDVGSRGFDLLLNAPVEAHLWWSTTSKS